MGPVDLVQGYVVDGFILNTNKLRTMVSGSKDLLIILLIHALNKCNILHNGSRITLVYNDGEI